MKSTYEFDDFDENQVIKLDDNQVNVASNSKNTLKSEQIKQNDDDDYQINIEQKEEERYSKPQTTTQNLQDNLQPQIQQLSEEQVIMITSGQQKPNKYGSFSGKATTETSLNQYGDPPLLQDIGLDPGLIIEKFLIVLKFQTPTIKHAQMTDLAGPIFLAFTLGFLLLGGGKVHFGDIYSILIGGNFLLCIFLNLISQTILVSLYTVMSVLGYSMLPLIIPGIIQLVFSLNNEIGILIIIAISIWSSLSATLFMQIILQFNQQNRRGILIYPIFLYYICFSIIIIF